VTSLLKPVSVVWAALIVATCTSTWWLTQHGVSPKAGKAAILLIAAFKVRLVMLHFMEPRNAPIAVRCLHEAWLVVATATILVIHAS
jgi:hypothetical protein